MPPCAYPRLVGVEDATLFEDANAVLLEDTELLVATDERLEECKLVKQRSCTVFSICRRAL